MELAENSQDCPRPELVHGCRTEAGYVELSAKTSFPGISDGKESASNVGDKIHWKREWQSTPVFLPGKFHGHWSLVGYSPCGHNELDVTEQLTLSLHFKHYIHRQPTLVFLPGNSMNRGA